MITETNAQNSYCLFNLEIVNLKDFQVVFTVSTIVANPIL